MIAFGIALKGSNKTGSAAFFTAQGKFWGAILAFRGITTQTGNAANKTRHKAPSSATKHPQAPQTLLLHNHSTEAIALPKIDGGMKVM